MRLTANSLIWLCAGRSPSEKPFLKLTATVERDGEVFALTSRWHSDIKNVIKIGVIRPDIRNGEAYLKTLSENPL